LKIAKGISPVKALS